MTQPRQSTRSQLAASLLLVLAVLVVFAPLTKHPFLELDDDTYVTRNPHVATGLSWNNTAWAFTAFHSSNWHPLTWISHQLDVSLFGLDPAGHHATSILLHAANTLLVLIVLARMTGAFWPSLFVAALFGLHPQRLESVAWVAERKDVLSAFFGLLCLLAWDARAKRPSGASYLLSLFAFALSLAAKPMLVALPFVLLLLSVWPLAENSVARKPWRIRIVELAPFFALAAASSVVTILAQRAAGSIGSLQAVPFSKRLANAVMAYVIYPLKLVWPTKLALVYPLPHDIPLWRWAGAAALLIAVTAVALASVRRRPWLTVGWGWYLVTLVPVIGLIQVGTQAYADRYTYFPLLGIGIVIAWSAEEVVAVRARLFRPLAGLAVASILALSALTLRQGTYWTSSERLFEHSLAVSPGSALIHNNYGSLLQRSGRREEARQQFSAALGIDPFYATARKNLGNVLLELQRPAEAVTELQRVVHQVPDYASAHNRLGVALATVGEHDEALQHLRRATELEPGDPRWRDDLVVELLLTGREAEAIPLLEAGLAAAGSTAKDARALNQLGIIRARQQRWDEAIDLFRRALALDPTSKDAESNLRQALASSGRRS